MASHKSPLRDRLLSNSPDPIKSSILRESGMGWNSPPTGSLSSTTSGGSITSPLRIAKRDSPGRPRGPDVARRSSSSFKHVTNNNLVSKSPFKSQIPTPSTPSRKPIVFPTRRVSGEKRPRPPSMHEQAETENERPFSLKRDRKQSKGFQGLIEREPVSKSPFKLQRTPKQEESRSPPPPMPIPSRMPIPSFAPIPSARIPAPAPVVDTKPSPVRSSLVSKRMHGPRLSGGVDIRKERRKTVSFDERCDVLEFDSEEHRDEGFDSADDDGYGAPEPQRDEEYDGDDPFFQGPSQQNTEQDDPMDEDESYDSIQLSDVGTNPGLPSLLDPDASITGLVDEMFSTAGHSIADMSNSSTPPRHNDIPTDLETEDGVPFGRSHHVERFLQHHEQHNINISPHHSPVHVPHFSPRGSPRQSPQIHSSPRQNDSPVQGYPYTFNLPTHASPHGPPATPPRRSPMQHSTPPLGRSTHVERIKKAREEEKDEEVEADVQRLPGSPSPMKNPANMRGMKTIPEEGLVPRFGIPGAAHADADSNLSTDIGPDPFALPRIQDEPSLRAEAETSGQVDDSVNDDHLSNGSSNEISDTKEDLHPDSRRDEEDISYSQSEAIHSSLPRQGSRPLPSPHTQDPLSFSPPHFGSPSSNRGDPPAERSVRNGSPIALPARFASPTARSSSPGLKASNSNQSIGSSGGGRYRITKEDVKRRLMRRRSFGSPDPEFENKVLDVPSRRSPAPSPATSEIAIRVEQDMDSDEEEEEEEEEEQSHREDDKERDRMSVMTGMTDISTETAIVQSAEKVNLDLSVGALVESDNKDFGLLGAGGGLQVDFGTRFGMGGLGMGSTGSRDSLGVIVRESEVKTGSVNSGSVKVGDVDVDMDMKSALDRLMDDVAGAGVNDRPDDSMTTDEFDDSYELPQREHDPRFRLSERAATDSALLPAKHTSTFMNRNASGSSATSVAPPVPPKDNIKNREQVILEKRREARRLEEEDEADFFSPAKFSGRGAVAEQKLLGVGRPSRRRSMSTGDAEELGGGAQRRGNVLLDMKEAVDDDRLSDSIEKELKRMVEKPTSKAKYHVREREGTIYASSDDKVSHMAGAGDLDSGKAWRTVRRPSDMNEYSKQIKEYRAQQNPAKAYGKVFVKVLGVKGLHLPLPQEPTAMTCTLNNGIHFVTTPECRLAQDCSIEQEFELIEHSKLEFTLTLKIRRDPHIIAQGKALAPRPAPVAPPPVVVQPPSRSGMRSFFSSSPKKSSKEKIAVQPPPRPQPAQPLPENLARYLKADGTLARVFISFRDVASRCDTRLFETSYPLIGQRVEIGGKFSTLQVGELVLQLFRLPPLPGIPPEQLPQSLEECHRGLRYLNWHKVTYFQGTLTQSGGDCSTWRRRQLRVIGSNLVAFNDVTKRATATIDLKKAIAVEDDQEARSNALSPDSRMSGRSSRYADDYDGFCGVERSFRLIFPLEQEIIFFADTDEEKTRWLEVLRALVGHIPPHPLWAELLWQRQEELSRQALAAQQGGQSPPQAAVRR